MSLKSVGTLEVRLGTFENINGIVHDSTMADMSGIYDNVYVRTCARVVMDSVFSKNNQNLLIKSSANNINSSMV